MSKEVIEKYITNGKLDLDRIVDEYSNYVRTIANNASKNLLSPEDKEEIMIDTFFILWKKYNDNQNIYALDAFIAGITRNLVKEKLRKKHYSVDIIDYENVIEIQENELFEEEREKIEQLKNSLKNLKDIDIKIINSYYYLSKSIKDFTI